MADAPGLTNIFQGYFGEESIEETQEKETFINEFGFTQTVDEEVKEEDLYEGLTASDFQQGKKEQESVTDNFDTALEDEWLEKFETLGDILDNARVQEWIIKNKLPKVGGGVIYGPTTSGKTLLAVDLALSLAAGLDECALGAINRRDVKGPQYVMYVALEGGAVHDNYIRAWLMGHPEVDEEVIREHFLRIDGAKGNLVHMETIGRDPILVPSEKNYNHFMKFGIDGLIKRGKKPALIIFDTQRYLMMNADENRSSDISPLYNQLKNDADQRELLSLTVHHTGKNTDNGPVGSGAITTNTDCVIEVKKATGEGKFRSYEWIKCKGAQDHIDGQAIMEVFPDPLDKNEDNDPLWVQQTIAYVGPVKNPKERLEAFVETHVPDTSPLQPDTDFMNRVMDTLRVEGHSQTALVAKGIIPGGQQLEKSKRRLEWMINAKMIVLVNRRYFVYTAPETEG